MSARPSIFDLLPTHDDANGRVFRHTPFGPDGQLQPDSALTFTWAPFRRESRHTDGLGNTRTFFFDAHGNALSITDEAGAETRYTYDSAAGRTHLRLTRSDAAGLATAYAYDAAGNLTAITLPSGRTQRFLDHTAFGQPRRIAPSTRPRCFSDIPCPQFPPRLTAR